MGFWVGIGLVKHERFWGKIGHLVLVEESGNQTLSLLVILAEVTKIS